MSADIDRSVLQCSGNYNCGSFCGFYHIMVEAQVYGACAQTRGKMSLLSTSLRSCRVHHTSDKFICETRIPDLLYSECSLVTVFYSSGRILTPN